MAHLTVKRGHWWKGNCNFGLKLQQWLPVEEHHRAIRRRRVTKTTNPTKNGKTGGCRSVKARNQLGTPGEAKSFRRGAQIFWTISNTIFQRGEAVLFGHRAKRFWNDRKKSSHFGQNVCKYRLKNTFMVSFNTTVRQRTEMFKRKMKKTGEVPP